MLSGGRGICSCQLYTFGFTIAPDKLRRQQKQGASLYRPHHSHRRLTSYFLGPTKAELEVFHFSPEHPIDDPKASELWWDTKVEPVKPGQLELFLSPNHLSLLTFPSLFPASLNQKYPPSLQNGSSCPRAVFLATANHRNHHVMCTI